MRTVEASRFVQEPSGSVERALSPSALIEYEGTFTVTGTSEDDGETLVTASAPGMTVEFVVEATEDGWSYEQRGESGPFEYMRTEVVVEPENEGSVVTLTSTVSLGLPAAFLTDRVAAWKRRRELERALDSLAADVE